MKRFSVTVLFLVTPLLSGCGFEPLLQSSSSASPSMEQPVLFVKTELQGAELEGYLVYQFRQCFLQQLGALPSSLAKGLRITVTLTLLPTDLLFKQDATVVRTQTRMKAVYQVSHPPSKRHFEGTTESVSSFAIDSSEEFMNLSAKNSSEERVIQGLTENIVQDILIKMSEEDDKKDGNGKRPKE